MSVLDVDQHTHLWLACGICRCNKWVEMRFAMAIPSTAQFACVLFFPFGTELLFSCFSARFGHKASARTFSVAGLSGY